LQQAAPAGPVQHCWSAGQQTVPGPAPKQQGSFFLRQASVHAPSVAGVQQTPAAARTRRPAAVAQPTHWPWSQN
jgi:hypothetical protein